MSKDYTSVYEPGFEMKNVCLWWDGTIRPGKGHNGTCRWLFDGQFTYHLRILKDE